MKISKAALGSALGLSAIHFLLVIGASKVRPDALNSGQIGSIVDKIEAVITQPGVWVADIMGCIPNKPMWWIFMVLSSLVWGNVIAFVIQLCAGRGKAAE